MNLRFEYYNYCICTVGHMHLILYYSKTGCFAIKYIVIKNMIMNKILNKKYIYVIVRVYSLPRCVHTHTHTHTHIKYTQLNTPPF